MSQDGDIKSAKSKKTSTISYHSRIVGRKFWYVLIYFPIRNCDNLGDIWKIDKSI